MKTNKTKELSQHHYGEIRMARIRLLQTSTIVLLGLIAMPAMSQSISHIAQPVQRHVNLTLRFDSATACPSQRAFYERFPSGNIASEEFRVPGNDLLVITDIHWQAVGEPTPFLTTGIVEAILRSGFGNQTTRVAYETATVNKSQDLAGADRIGNSEHIISGIRIGSGRYMCMSAVGRTRNSAAAHTIRETEITGYLISK